jgi:mono/diheme cytochrome c family protein
MAVYPRERRPLHHPSKVSGTIALFLFTLGMHSASAQSDANKGAARIYVDQGCAVCHGLMGRGGVGPNFVGDHFLVIGDYVIAQILLGRGQMPSFADKLSDDQIAAVASYIRQSWDNKLSDLSPDQVKQVRSKLQTPHQ